MKAASEGLGSAELKQNLALAIAKRPNELGFWLMRLSGLPSPRPNLALAAGFGAEAAAHGAKVLPLLALYASDESPPVKTEAFLPMAAAFGYAQLLRRKVEERACWAALFALAADDRGCVQQATIAALTDLAASSGADRLVAEVDAWLEAEDRDVRWGAVMVAIAVLSDRRALEGLTDRAGWLDRLTRTLTDVADAPRAAERSETRRRILDALPAGIALAAQTFHAAPDGMAWLEAECRRTTQVEVRAALASAIDRLRKRGASEKTEVLEVLRAALASSAKPDRHAARVREGTGRGKKQQSRGG